MYNKLMEELYTKAKQDTKIGNMNAPSGVVAEKFAEMIVRNCIFEMVHESTWYHNKELQDFTVDVTERICEKFGLK